MKKVSFDFDHIQDVQGFYRHFTAAFAIDMAFGNNLDALWDALTGMIDLPARITLRHLTRHSAPSQFDAVIAVLREAERALAGQLIVKCAS